MAIKSATGEIKALAEDGTGRAVFATLNVVDKDGDVTLPGAFKEQTVKLVGGHEWKQPNIGYAKIREEGEEAVADFQFYLDMPSAKEWYTAVKKNFEAGVPQEYSYGFHVRKDSVSERDGRKIRELQDLDVFEVSFVMSGAGEDTRTLEVKDTKAADEKPAEPAPEPKADEKPAESKPADAAFDSKNFYLDHGFSGSWEAYQGALREAAVVKFTHDAGADTWVGLIATYDGKACVSVERYEDGIRKTAYYELSWEMRDDEMHITGSREVELKLKTEPVDKVPESADSHLARAKALRDALAKEGRVLSAANRGRLDVLAESLEKVSADIRQLLTDTAPPERDAPAEDEDEKISEAAEALAAVAESQAALARSSLSLAQ